MEIAKKKRPTPSLSFISLYAFLLLGLIFTPAWSLAQENTFGRSGGATSSPTDEAVSSRYVEGEILVKLKPGLNTDDLNAIMGGYALNIEKRYPILSKMTGSEYALLKSSSRSTAELVSDFQNHSMVDRVSPNFYRKADSTPNDPLYPDLWGLNNTGQSSGTADADIDAPESWNVSTGSNSVIVAVIDTGVGYDHEDLSANMWTNPKETPNNGIDDDENGYVDDIYGIDTVNDDSDPMDDGGHGSHCAGTIAGVGNNGKGVVGVNWSAKIMALKFLSSLGHGEDADAIEAIEYIIDQKINEKQNVVAINASWGGGEDNPLLSDAIKAAGDAGILFCAAAGNDTTDTDATPHYPSSYAATNIISVASTTRTDGLSSFSNYGAKSVDLGAPGSSIISTVSFFDAITGGNIFSDDLEAGFGKWTSGGTNNSWAITTDRESFFASGQTRQFGTPPSGDEFLSDSPGTDYLVNTDSWVGNNTDINLSSYGDQVVYFGFSSAFICDFWWGEKAILEISKDSGATWSTLFDLSDWYLYWNYWGWGSDVVIIPDAYKTAYFRFRFHFTSDGTNNNTDNDDAGWVIDNVGIGANLAKEYASYSGTSMATPHVAGAIALMASKYPSESMTDRKTRILENVDKLSSLSGKTVTGGRLNLQKAINAPSKVADFPWILYYPAFTNKNR